MKWLSELNDIKTPDSWIEDTLNMTSRKEDNRGRRREEKRGSVVKMHKGAGNIVKAAVVAGVLIAVSGGSVYAYNQYVAKYSMSNTASSLDHMGQSVDEDGNVYSYDAAQKVNETAVSSSDALSVEATNVITEAHQAVITLAVKSKNGEPIVYNDETRLSYPARQRFETAMVIIDDVPISGSGVSSGVWVQRVDDASVPSEARFELTVRASSVDFAGKDMKVRLTNFVDSWEVTKGIGFSYDSVADILAQGKAADSSSFKKVEKGKYADGSSQYEYALNPGSYKIKFSEQYPDAYIDNMGFGPRTDYDNTNAFYITVVPGRYADALEKLCFQNKTTGMMYNSTSIRKLDDGRIQVSVSPNQDRQYSRTNSGVYQNSTTDMLKNYRLVLNNPDKEPLTGNRYEGTWEFTVKSDESQAVADRVLKNLDITPDITSNYAVTGIRQVTLTDTEFAMEFDTDYTKWGNDKTLFTKFQKSIKIVMSNGSKISLGNKVGGGWSDRETAAEMDGRLPTFIDADDAVGIEIGGHLFKFE